MSVDSPDSAPSPPAIAPWLALRPMVGMMLVSTLILLACSSLKHGLFHSTAFDLGIFDQAIYLISQGLPPQSSIINMHILGDHAAPIHYGLALLYWLYPDVHWLLVVQAVGLSLGALPTWALARQAGLTLRWATVMAAAYLLYPLLFNINLFDFHPDVLAPVALLTAVWAARQQRWGWFAGAIALTLSLKAVFALTVAALGLWLLLLEKRRTAGAIALIAGIVWFAIATQWIIPHFKGGEAAAVVRYGYLGNSVLEILQNLVLKPGLILGRLLSFETVKYLVFLGLPLLPIVPLLVAIAPASLWALIPALPALGINILSDSAFQRSLAYQYSLPVLPFLIVVAIAALSTPHRWTPRPRWVLAWSLVAFVLMAKYRDIPRYFDSLDTQAATQAAIAQIAPQAALITDSQMVPHLTHRPIVKKLRRRSDADLKAVDYVLLNLRHPWVDEATFAQSLFTTLQSDPAFALHYSRDDVYLFKRLFKRLNP